MKKEILETITFKDGIVNFRGVDYPYRGIEKLDEEYVHLHLSIGQTVCFGISETELNGKVYSTVKEFSKQFSL